MAEKKCNGCKDVSRETAQVPYIAHESEAMRQHKIIKWLILLNVLTIILLGAMFAWNVYNSTAYETVVETYEVDQDTENGYNNCVINGGEICNGETNG